MKKLGLVLGGGGARGSYQVGVLKALMEYDLLKGVKVVAGTSIGAVNTCLVMEKLNYDEMLAFWSEINNETLYRLDLKGREGINKYGLFDQKAMFDTLAKLQSKEALWESDIRGFAVATKLNEIKAKEPTLESVAINLNESSDPHLAVLASTSIPVVFTPTEIDGHNYVDGGILNNLPVNVALENECDIIIAIGLTSYKFDKYDLSNKLLLNFSPVKRISLTLLGMLDFSHDSFEKNVIYGYESGIKLIQQLIEKEIIKDKTFNTQKCGIYELDNKDQLKITD